MDTFEDENFMIRKEISRVVEKEDEFTGEIKIEIEDCDKVTNTDLLELITCLKKKIK